MSRGRRLAWQDKSAKASSKANSSSPSDKDIADARTEGYGVGQYQHEGISQGRPFLWKNQASGKFMSEADAQKAGFRAAQEPGSKKGKDKTTK